MGKVVIAYLMGMILIGSIWLGVTVDSSFFLFSIFDGLATLGISFYYMFNHWN